MEELTTSLRNSTDIDDVTSHRVLSAIASYLRWAEREFAPQHDSFRLLGEDNFRRYLPIGALRLRIHPSDAAFDVLCRAAAARVAGCLTTVSVPPDLPAEVARAVENLDQWTDPWAGAIEFLEETDEQLAEVILAGHSDRVRYAAPGRVPQTVREASASALQYIADRTVSAHGRLELLWYFQEQSLTHMYHRYGNLGGRVNESRAETL